MEGRIVPLVEVDIGLLADQVGVATTDTLDLGHGVHDLLLAIDLCNNPSVSSIFAYHRMCPGRENAHVGVQQTQDVLKVRLLSRNERHRGGDSICCR